MSLRSMLGGVGRAVAGFAGGGVLGGLTSVASSLQRTPVRQPGNSASITLNNPFTQGGGIIGYLTGHTGKGHGRMAPVNGQCAKGYHLNKHKLADGTPAKSVCVRNRSMNALNGRAAMHAVRRVKRAEKLVRRLKIFKPVHRLASAKPCGHSGRCSCK